MVVRVQRAILCVLYNSAGPVGKTDASEGSLILSLCVTGEERMASKDTLQHQAFLIMPVLRHLKRFLRLEYSENYLDLKKKN